MKKYTFICTVTGRGGHGAMPDTAIDPVVAAAALVRSAGVGLPAGTVEWSAIHGGTRFNIIPQQVSVSGVLAAPEAELAACRARLEENVENVMAALRTQAALAFEEVL